MNNNICFLVNLKVSVIFDGENELEMADEENTPYAKKVNKTMNILLNFSFYIKVW